MGYCRSCLLSCYICCFSFGTNIRSGIYKLIGPITKFTSIKSTKNEISYATFAYDLEKFSIYYVYQTNSNGYDHCLVRVTDLSLRSENKSTVRSYIKSNITTTIDTDYVPPRKDVMFYNGNETVDFDLNTLDKLYGTSLKLAKGSIQATNCEIECVTDLILIMKCLKITVTDVSISTKKPFTFAKKPIVEVKLDDLYKTNIESKQPDEEKMM